MITGNRWAWHLEEKLSLSTPHHRRNITCYNVTNILEYCHACKMVASNGTLHVIISTDINEIRVTSDGSQLRISSARDEHIAVKDQHRHYRHM